MRLSAPDIVVLRKGTEGLSTDDYAQEIRDRLPDHDVVHARTPGQEREFIANARIATGVGIDEALLSNADNLEMFVVASSGYGHLPIDAFNERGVPVVNAAGIHAPAIADQTLGYCLLFARQLHKGLDQTRNREWRHYQADELTGSTVTVVGMGSIGQAIVKRLEGFDVHTIGVRYTPKKGGPTDEVIGFDPESLHEALSRTDYLVLSTPLSETTRGLIGSEELATMPPDSYLFNVSRGAVVDTDALLAALQKDVISGAALDVTDPEPLAADHPLWGLRNVLITPHMGGHTPHHWERLADILASNVRKLEADEVEELQNYVNESELQKENPTQHRAE